MSIIFVLYSINAMLLVLHEIESAYWKEWEIFRMKGGITLFVLLHVPLLLVILLGSPAVIEGNPAGTALSLVTGAGGWIPLFVHKVFIRVKDRFNTPLSLFIMISNALTGTALIIAAGIR